MNQPNYNSSHNHIVTFHFLIILINVASFEQTYHHKNVQDHTLNGSSAVPTFQTCMMLKIGRKKYQDGKQSLMARCSDQV
jgi:hypothetical protein